MKTILTIIFVFFMSISSSSAETTVIDGDSIIVEGDEIRLIGVDAPEYGQFCFDETGLAYNCGDEAKNALNELVKDKKVICNKIKKDIYDRDLSECFIDETNINKELLKMGWVVVYRSDDENYKKAQEDARANRRGVWKGRFMKPEFHRVLNRNKKDKNFL